MVSFSRYVTFASMHILQVFVHCSFQHSTLCSRELLTVNTVINFKEVVTAENEMGGTCGTSGGEQNAYRNLVGKPEGKRPHGRPTRIFEYIIKVNLKRNGRVLTDFI